MGMKRYILIEIAHRRVAAIDIVINERSKFAVYCIVGSKLRHGHVIILRVSDEPHPSIARLIQHLFGRKRSAS